MPTTLSILVFVAAPLDYARYRHTALYFQFGETARIQEQDTIVDTDLNERTQSDDVTSSVMEIIGSPGFFSFSERLNWEIPATSTNLAHVIPVSTIPDSVSPSSLREIVSGTTILNGSEDGDWNSQNWVGDVLGRMVEKGILGFLAMDRGIDGMVDAILEAADEEMEYMCGGKR